MQLATQFGLAPFNLFTYYIQRDFLNNFPQLLPTKLTGFQYSFQGCRWYNGEVFAKPSPSQPANPQLGAEV